jgi:hypothetical protein
MALPLDFAFEGFRLIRARPRLLALWGIATLFGYGLAAVMFVATFGPLQPLIANASLHPIDTLSESAEQQFLLVIFSVAPILLLTDAVLACAVCRAGLEEGEDPFGYLRFGARELQVLMVMAGSLLMTALVLLSVFSAFMSLRPPAAFAGAGLVLSLLCAAFVRIRLSLNVPQSFVERRIDLFGSVALTRGRFWPLAGGYVMATAMSFVVQYLSQQVIRAVIVTGFGENAATSVPDMSSLAAFFTPAHVVEVAMLCGLVMPQTSAIMLAAPLGAWKALKPTAPPITVAP